MTHETMDLQVAGRRRTMRAPKPWMLAAGGFIAGAYLILFPGGIAHAFFSPQPTIIIRTISNDTQKTTSAVLGQGKVPIDVDGDGIPDIDAGVSATSVDSLPGHPVAPRIDVARDAASLNPPLVTALPVATPERATPPLQIEVILSTFDPQTNKTDTVSLGYDTQPGGSIPTSWSAVVLANLSTDADPSTFGATLIEPLDAEITSPGYNGPLRVFSNIDARSLTTLHGAISLGFDPLPERVHAHYASLTNGMQFAYEQTSLVPEVDLDAIVHLETPSGVTDVTSLIQRLPATMNGSVTNGAAGGEFTFGSTSPAAKPDIDAAFTNRPVDGDPIVAVARVSGLPSSLHASWPLEGGTAKKVSFDAPDPVGAIDFEVRNFIDPKDGAHLPPALRLPPADHVQFVSRGIGDDTLWTARGHVSSVRAISYEQKALDEKVVHAEIGHSVHPFRAGVDVQTGETARLLVDATVTNLPNDLTLTYRPQDDTQPDDVPMLFSHHASAETDIVSHVETADSLSIGCESRGSMCLDATVRHLPETLTATVSSALDHGKIRITAVPREGGAQPDITADVVRVPADAAEAPIDLHASIQRFPKTFVSTYHLTDKQPDLVDMHACDWDGAACADGAPLGIGKVNFRARNFLHASFGTDEITPSNYVSIVSRKLPDRFEVSGQATDIRHLAYRKIGQVGGVHVEMGKGEPFRVHADLDDPGDSPSQQQIADSVISSLPDTFNLCFRSPSDDPVAVATDTSGITNACQTDQAFGTTVDVTPFTVVYDATGAAFQNPIVTAKARVLFGGANPIGAGERQNPAQRINIATRVENLPTVVRADYQPSKDNGNDVFERPLKFDYVANQPIGHVTLDLQSLDKVSQCEDPRPDASSLCAHADIRNLPTLLQGTIGHKPSDDAPVTTFRFHAGTGAEAAAMRMGCTGLLSCKGFQTGLHLVKVENPGPNCVAPDCGGRPISVDASLEGLPTDIIGEMDAAKKIDPEDGTISAKPALTKIFVRACSQVVNEICTANPGKFGAVRFKLQDFLVPDPLPNDAPATTLPAPPFAANTAAGGEFFHFFKRADDFRISGALRGLTSAVFASPGDTTAVDVGTTKVERNLETIFDMQDPNGDTVRVAGAIQHLPQQLKFCFRAPRIQPFPASGISAGDFCDASNTSANNAPPGATKDDSDTRLRLFGLQALAKPNANLSFAIGAPGTNTQGEVTALGLPSVMQATFAKSSVGFNQPGLPGFTLPNPNVIDSLRFDIRKDFPPGAAPTEPPFGEQRHFPTASDHSEDDPNAVPLSNATPLPYISLVKNVARLQVKGIANGIQEVSMVEDPCEYPDGGAPDPVPTCKHMRAKVGVGLTPQVFGFYMNMLDGLKRLFLTADIGPLPSLIDAHIDTGSSGFEPDGDTLAQQVALKTTRPPLIVLHTCEVGNCSVPSGSPSIRAVFETGTLKSLKKLANTAPQDPLFDATPPDNPDLDAGLAGVSAYDYPVTDKFYDPEDKAAAADLLDSASNTPPAVGAPDATAIRVVTIPGKETGVRARLKIPFPGSLTIDPPVMLSFDDNEADPYHGHSISDMKVGFSARGFGSSPAPIDLGRTVAVIDDMQNGPGHGGENVIIADNLPGVAKLQMVNHNDKTAGRTFIDAGGSFSSDLTRLEARMWSNRDENNNLKRVTARGDIPVPNLRVNVHNIPGGSDGWRARLFMQDGPPEDRANHDPCKDKIIAVILNLIPCTTSQYADFALDFHPAEASGTNPPARRIDAIVNSTSGNHAAIYGYTTTDGSAPADFDARASVRIDPLDIVLTAGVPGLAGLVFTLFSELDVNLYSIGQNYMELEFKAPGHVSLTRNDPPGADSDHAAEGLQPGLYLRPVWDVDWLFGEGNVLWFVFFGVGPHASPPLYHTLPMAGLDCGFGSLAGGAFPELEYIGSSVFGHGSNGYSLTGGDYHQSLVLNAMAPPGVAIGDISGGLITRGIVAIAETIFCAFNPDPLPSGAPYDPLAGWLGGGSAPPLDAGAPPPPIPKHVTIPVGTTLLCGRHDYAQLTVPSGATIKVSDHAILDGSGNPINAAGEDLPACLAKDVGTLRITAKKLPGDPTSGIVTVAAGGKIDGNGSMVGEPPAKLADGGHVSTIHTGDPISFAPFEGRPDSGGGTPDCGGGGGYGGTGGASACRASPLNNGGFLYGNAVLDPTNDFFTIDPETGSPVALDTIYPGSSGANAGSSGGVRGGNGGGMVEIDTETFNLSGTITANGDPGANGSNPALTCLIGSGAGGGSGGGVEVIARNMNTVAGATVTVKGGNGGAGFAGGGGGGGGRIKILGILQSGPAIVSSASGGAPTGLACGSLTPGFGSGGSIIAPPDFRAGGSLSEADTVSGTRTPPDQTTQWTNAPAVAVQTSSAATGGGIWPFHEVMLCYVYEQADRDDHTKLIPEKQPMKIPARAGGESLVQYLRDDLHCSVGDKQNRVNGVATSGSFGRSVIEGYYGYFTVTARRYAAGGGELPSTPCFQTFFSFFFNVDEDDCQIEPVPQLPDVVLGVDQTAPVITKLKHFPSPQAEDQVFVPDNVPDQLSGLYTNDPNVNLKAEWVDGFGGVTVSDSQTLYTTLNECFSNDGGATSECYGRNDTALDPGHQSFPEDIGWVLDTGGGDGLKTVQVVVTDLAGNSSTATKKTITLDTNAPQVTVTGSPPTPPLDGHGWYRTPPTATLALAGVDAGVGIDNPTTSTSGVYYSFDDPEGASIPYTTGAITMPEGDHTLYSFAIDRLGNHSTFVNSFEAKVDTIAPITAVSVVPGAPDGQNGWYVTRPFVGAASIDNVGGSGHPHIAVRTGPDLAHLGPFQPYTGFFQLNEGTTVVCARATDDAGNVGAQDCSVPIQVDTTLPVSPLSVPSPNGDHLWYTTRPTTSVTTFENGSGLVASLDDLDVDAAGLWVSIDHTPWFDAGSSHARLTPEGVHDLRWFAEDAAGNRERIQQRVLHVDTSDPLSVLASFPTAPNDQGWFRAPVFTRLAATDGEDNSGVLAADWGLDGPASNGYTEPFVIGSGAHTLDFRATDASGRQETDNSLPVSVDLQAPTADVTAPGPLPVLALLGEPAALTFTTKDDLSSEIHSLVRIFDVTGAVVRTIDAGAQAAGPTNVVWDGIDAAGDRALPGIYYFRVLTVDEAGNTGVSGESREFLVL